MLDKMNEMREQRRALLSKLSDELQNDDITAKCLAEKNEDNLVGLMLLSTIICLFSSHQDRSGFQY